MRVSHYMRARGRSPPHLCQLAPPLRRCLEWCAGLRSLSRRATGEAMLGEEPVSRRLVAIVAAKVVGYTSGARSRPRETACSSNSRMAADEEGTPARLKSRRLGLIHPEIALRPIAAG